MYAGCDTEYFITISISVVLDMECFVEYIFFKKTTPNFHYIRNNKIIKFNIIFSGNFFLNRNQLFINMDVRIITFSYHFTNFFCVGFLLYIHTFLISTMFCSETIKNVNYTKII